MGVKHDPGASPIERDGLVKGDVAGSPIVLLHSLIHASWLNQVEISFSIVQRKVLTPNDFASIMQLRIGN